MCICFNYLLHISYNDYVLGPAAYNNCLIACFDCSSGNIGQQPLHSLPPRCQGMVRSYRSIALLSSIVGLSLLLIKVSLFISFGICFCSRLKMNAPSNVFVLPLDEVVVGVDHKQEADHSFVKELLRIVHNHHYLIQSPIKDNHNLHAIISMMVAGHNNLTILADNDHSLVLNVMVLAKYCCCSHQSTHQSSL